MNFMNAYRTRAEKLTGTDYHEVYVKAFALYKQIKSKSKRRPYVRSHYFKNSKVFLELFWHHLDQKKWPDRFRRMKYFPCALELIQKSRIKPASKLNPNKSSEILYRFIGMTPDHSLFLVQIKENIRKDQKWFMSVFPWK